MTAGDQQAAETALETALKLRNKAKSAERAARTGTMLFIDAALTARWTWAVIGTRLGVSATGARRYYARNRRRIHTPFS